MTGGLPSGVPSEGLSSIRARFDGDCIVLGTLPAVRRAMPDIDLPQTVDAANVIARALNRMAASLCTAVSWRMTATF